ncbi:outer membrane lipoprotein chaperone LolA [Lysobacter sp. D1-1-M9]|uniref:outer membrane lipoprotein chaperone LolA n=1 Tax=Novilysobacter longmucuonensis TaxID=3098603 RepID=UPI002FCA619C
MIRIARYAALVTALFATSAFAGARDDLNTFTQGLKGLEGQFTQRVFDRNGKLKETSSGQVALSVPDRFRWEYVTPYPQLIVADGETVWIHDPDLEQATRRPQGAEEQTSPLSALIDPTRLDAQFQVEEGTSTDGIAWLSLAPKNGKEASFRTARLGFADGALVEMQVVDAIGQHTRISFSDWQRNPRFDESTFSYTPAAGTDVIGG